MELQHLFAYDVEFNRLRSGETSVNLLNLLLEFARDAYPKLDRVACWHEIKRLTDGALGCLRPLRSAGASTAEQLARLSVFLYDEQGFAGNEGDYYNARNSYINELLVRRQGIPITLGILYTCVGKSAGMDLHGICAPGHFLVGCRDAAGPLYVDPFYQGTLLTAAECRRRIEQVLGEPGVADDYDFAPADDLQIAIRVLHNLKAIYLSSRAWEAALPVQQRLALLRRQVAEELRDLGLVYLHLSQPVPAIEHLTAYMEECADDDREVMVPFLQSARRLLAELN